MASPLYGFLYYFLYSNFYNGIKAYGQQSKSLKIYGWKIVIEKCGGLQFFGEKIVVVKRLPIIKMEWRLVNVNLLSKLK